MTGRYRSHQAKEPHELVANRAVTLGSTVGIGGSIAYFAGLWLDVPEEAHAHLTALVIFGWNTAVFLVAFFWRRRFGG